MKSLKILIRPKDREILMRKFNCSESLVYKAIRYESNGMISRKLRSYAMNFLKCHLI